MSVEKVVEDDQQREKVYRLVILALVGVLVATWVAVIWLVQGKNSAEEERDKAEQQVDSYAVGPEAQAAAEEILGVITSYDYREIDEVRDNWTRYLADDQKDHYANDVIPNLVKAVKLTKTVAVGEVVHSAYTLIDDDHVKVLAYVRQRIRSKDDPKGVLDAEWYSIAMVREGDDWLVEKVNPFDVPPPE